MHPSGLLRNRRGRIRFLLCLFALLGIVAAWTPPPGSAFAAADIPAGSQNIQGSAAYSISSDVPALSVVSQGKQRYFAQTAHFLRGVFLDYWNSHGSTAVLGLPITEPVVEDGLTVQYLERARLEYHPEIPGTGQSKVLLTRLGVTLAEQRGLHFDSLFSGIDSASSLFFTQTGHTLSNGFLTFWQQHGGLAVFGYPISEEFTEINDADGQQYTVQYFERNRFEWHPELSPPNNVQLGLLGVEYARSTNIDPLARIELPAPLPAADTDLSNDPRLANLVDPGLLPAIQELGRTPQFRWVPAVIIQNNVVVQFTQIQDQDVGGAFITTGSRRQPYLIVIPEQFRDEPSQALASVLAHEATHAYDFTGGLLSQQTNCSIEEELRAYKNGLAAWIVLKGGDALAGDYRSDAFENDLNSSLVGFNNDQDQLGFDLDLSRSRLFLRDLYGPDCGS
jgi:hypothetical protein